MGASSSPHSPAAMNIPRTNRACGFLSLLLQNRAQLLHLPGCSWLTACEACGILSTCGSGRKCWGMGQEVFLWGAYGSSSLTHRSPSQTEPAGLPGHEGTNGGDKSRAGRAGQHGTHCKHASLLHQPCTCAPSKHLVTLEGAVWTTLTRW